MMHLMKKVRFTAHANSGVGPDTSTLFETEQDYPVTRYLVIFSTMKSAGHEPNNTLCPRSLDPIYIVTYYMKQVKTSWTDSTWSPDIRYNTTREGFFVNLGWRDCTIFRDTICTAAPADFSVIIRFVQEVWRCTPLSPLPFAFYSKLS